MRIVAQMPQEGGPRIPKNPTFLKNGKKSPKTQKLRNSEVSNPSGSVFSTMFCWTKNTPKPDFFEKRKKSSKRKNSKTSRNNPKLAIRPSTRGLIHWEAWFPGGPKIPQNPIFLKNGKNLQKRKNSKTSRDMLKLAIRPSTRGL